MSDKYIYIPDFSGCLDKLRHELRDADTEKLIERFKRNLSFTPDESLQLEIYLWVNSYERDLKNGQKQCFLRADELTKETSILNKMIEIFRNIAAQQKEKIESEIKF